MSRPALIKQIESRLGERRVVYAGVRGSDAEALADLQQFDSCLTILDRYSRRPSVTSLAYEDLTQVRPDLERWDIEEHPDTHATAQFRQELLRRLAVPSALVPYRPSNFLSAIALARRDRCINLGMFGAHQSAFEHKPWVESQLAEYGIQTIPWTYVADEDQFAALDAVPEGPLVLRRSRTSGGEGIVRVEDRSQLPERWMETPESFLSVAPFIEGALPLNVGATVWDDGVTVQHPSVQLVGVPELGRRRFGYCGNDFGLAGDLEPDLIDLIEETTVAIGSWLHSRSYRGTFGVDYLLTEGRLLFTEVNPRFQGSTYMSSRLSVEADEPCLLTEHVAAMLHIQKPELRALRERLADHGQTAHLVMHASDEQTTSVDASRTLGLLTADERITDVTAVASGSVRVEPDAIVLRFATNESVTATGFDLSPEWSELVDTARGALQRESAEVAT